MSFANIIGGMLFSGIGFVALAYGKKQYNFKTIAIGVILMVYPYFMPNTLALYSSGVILTIGLFVFR